VIDMRAQPQIDSTYLRVTTGGSDVQQAAPVIDVTRPSNLVQGPSGSVQQVDERGGTILYWRED
jgi:hypothetical protein